MIRNNIKKLTAVLLAVVLFAQSVPALAIDVTKLSIPEISDISVSVEPSTVDAELPPTFIVDDSCIDASSEYQYTPISEQETPSDTSTEVISQITEPEKISDEESVNIARLVDILEKNKSLSDLSKDDLKFICDYMQVDESSLLELENIGLTLGGSILYSQLANEYGFTVKEIYEACPTESDCVNLSTQLRQYTIFLSENLAGSDIDKELRNYLLAGFTFDQVKTAYALSVTLDVDMSSLLTSDMEDTATKLNSLSEVDSNNYELFASDLGVDVNALVDYAVENGLDFSEMEQLINSGLSNETELSDSLSSSPQMTMTMSEEDEGEEETVYTDKYIGAPNSYNYDENESVNLNTGSLEYENVDYTLPGVNGLDLVIGHRYESAAANVYDPIGIRGFEYDYDYEVIYGAEAYYYVPGIGTGDWDYYDLGPYTENLSTYADALSCYNSLPSGEVVYEDFDDGADLILEYYKIIVRYLVDITPYSFTTVQSNTYLNDLYGLGNGWSFMFSSIENGKYLYLADGRSFKIDITSTTGDSNLKDYTLSDLRLEQESGAYSNGSVSSYYTLYYKDGKKEFFSNDGKLIGIKDRFDNTIKFVNDTYNDYPRITITDTLNRVTTISGQSTASGHTMAVSLPDSVSLSYTIEDTSSPVSCKELAQYNDPMNTTTNYSYTISSGGFNVFTKSLDVTNYFVNLTTITHPTGAQTVYAYTHVFENLGSEGLRLCYRLVMRGDVVGTTYYNVQVYSYSANNNSGYPAYSDPDSLPTSFTYYTTVMDGSYGVATTYNFNNENLTTSAETTLGNIKIQDALYEYNADELPTKETIKSYDYTDQNMYVQSIEAYAYDNKANVTASWSPLAEGDVGNTEHKTTYTYDSTYSLPLTVTYKQDELTTAMYDYTLDSEKKEILCEEVYVNSVRKSMTDYTYDSYGNVDTEKSYKDNFVDYYLTEYSYQNNAYLSGVTITGVLDADNEASAGTPTFSAGTVVASNHYNNLGLLDQSTDANGNTTQYVYDNNRNVTLITNPDSTTKQYTRDYSDNYVIVTDENDDQLKYTYTPLGLSYQTIDVQTNMPLSSRTYDALSRLTTVTDAVYGSVTTYTYDYLSRETSEVVTQGANTLSHITYAYTEACENGTLQEVTKTVVGETNAPSIVTTQYTDKMGNVVKNGKIFEAVEYFDTYDYDYVGNKCQEKLAYATQLAVEPTYTSKWEYDYAKRPVKAYNVDGDYIQYTYDALGNLVSAVDYAGTETTYTYDSLSRKLTETFIIDQGNGYSGMTKYYYDAAGNVISKKISNNPVGDSVEWSQTDFEYDSRNRLEYVTVYDDANIDNVTRYEYDGAGNTLATYTGKSSKEANDGESTSYTYDRFSNMLTFTDPLNQTESYDYTTLGKLDTKTDRNGNVTQYVFDGLGRPLSTSVTVDGEQQTVNMTYTLTGAKESDANDTATVEYQYDDLGRNIRIDETGGNGNIVKQYTYDLANNRKTFALSVGGSQAQSMFYDYDNQNRLYTVSENSVLKATYTYDINGNRDTLIYSNGSGVEYDYNDANWVTGITNKTGATVLSTYNYDYYADGNELTKTDDIGKVTTYEYDDAGRLTSERDTTGAAVSYDYDRFSNRVEMEVTGSESYTVNYSYDDNNRLENETKTTASATETTTYFYDPNGNQISKANEILLDGPGTEAYVLTNGVASCELNSYNGFNQLIETDADNVTVKYTYYPSGLRASKDVNGTETDYITDGADVVAEVSDGDITAQYIRGINLLYSTIDGDISYYLYNAHGDVVQLADTAGVVTKVYDYDAFGNEAEPDSADTNPYRYCGEYLDLSSGTYYLRARNYDPTIGRFLSEDTHWNVRNMVYGDDPLKLNQYTALPSLVAIMQSGNLYVYCMNNPTMYVDVTGELAYPGQIHNLVVAHVAAEYGLYTEQTINYSFGWGRADLISSSGQVWDVKRDKPNQVASGVSQVLNYTQNIWKKFPDVALSVGGYVDPNSFVVTLNVDTYYISYHYAEGGVIAYDYYKVTDWQKVGEVATGIVVIAGVTFAIVVTDGLAAPVLVPVAAKALGG